MISIEAECPAAAGHDFVLAGAGEALQLLADIAGPYLSTLPLGQSTPVATDDHLPVLGSTMAGLVQLLRVFAQQDETVLIGGPTGAGKSRLARWCHERSPRRGQCFEALDLLTVPEDLQMAELFGWRKGAFTGAVRDTPGSVARAEGGTLFIDEIDKLSMKAQAGLLHLLEERKYRPLGEAARERRANVRFVIGTNMDLHGLVQAGRFREDLYYRINVLPVRVPALADRRDEIAPWARYMAIRRHREAVPGGEVRLSAAAEHLLGEQQWPGNLRQLDNVVRRAYTLALMGAGGQSAEVLLDEQHVAQALGLERASPRRSVLESMRGAAAAFVEEAARLGDRGGTLDLDLCDAFRGLALGTAVQRLGSREAAFRLLGKAAQVQGRNHHKALRRELEKVEALCKALGMEGGSPFASLVDGDDPGVTREG